MIDSKRPTGFPEMGIKKFPAYQNKKIKSPKTIAILKEKTKATPHKKSL